MGKSCISVKAAVAVLLVLEILVLVFGCLSAVFSQYTVRDEVLDYYPHNASLVRMSKDSCFTFWGYKVDCGKSELTYKGDQAFGCPQRKEMIVAAGGFTVAATVLAFLTAIMSIVMLARVRCLAILPFTAVAFSAMLFFIAMVYVLDVYGRGSPYCTTRYYANAYKDDTALEPRKLMSGFKDFTKLGVGFAMLATSLALQLVGVILLTILVVFG